MNRNLAPGLLSLVCLALVALAPLRAEDAVVPAAVSLTATAEVAKSTAPQAAANPQPIDVAIATEQHVIIMRLLVKQASGDYIEQWEKFLERRFKAADADNDGTLSGAEMKAVRPLLSAVPQNRRNQRVVFANGIAENDNGNALTSDPPVDVSRQLSPGATLQQFVEFMRSGFNTPVRVEGSVSISAGSKALFARLDANHDGTLSMDECARAYDVLRQIDYFNIELIGRNQLQLAEAANTPNGQVRQQNSQPTRLALKLLSQGGIGMAVNWAEKLQNHFAAGSMDEAQTLRTVPRAALLYDEETFSPFDADGDGKLDQDELAHFMRRPLPNVELVVNADREGSLPEPTVSHLDAGVGHLDDPSGHPTLVAGRERIELTAGSFNSARGEYQNVRNRFMRADQDKNDYLDKNEIQRFGLEGIETLDTDGDGKLYLQEITDFLDAAAEMAAHRLLVAVTDHGHGLFEALDADHDDQLSHRELMQLAQSAKLWDLNGDGQLTLEEVPHLYSLQVSQQPVQLPFNNGFFRQNFGRGRMANGRAFKAAPAWFSSMDRNSDGDLSLQEFLGTPAQFRQFDANGDQLIDSQEANAQITPAVTATAAAAVPPPVTPPPAGDAAEGEEPIGLP